MYISTLDTLEGHPFLPASPLSFPSSPLSFHPSSHLAFHQAMSPSQSSVSFPQAISVSSRSFQVLPGSLAARQYLRLSSPIFFQLSFPPSTIQHPTLSPPLSPHSSFRPCTVLQWRRQPWVHGRRCSSSLHSSSPLSLDQFSHCWYQSSPSLDAASFTLAKVIPPSPFTLHLIKTTDVSADLASNRQRTARTNTSFYDEPKCAQHEQREAALYLCTD